MVPTPYIVLMMQDDCKAIMQLDTLVGPVPRRSSGPLELMSQALVTGARGWRHSNKWVGSDPVRRALEGPGPATEGRGRHAQRHRSAVFHGLELAAQQIGVRAGDPGVRHRRWMIAERACEVTLLGLDQRRLQRRIGTVQILWRGSRPRIRRRERLRLYIHTPGAYVSWIEALRLHFYGRPHLLHEKTCAESAARCIGIPQSASV